MLGLSLTLLMFLLLQVILGSFLITQTTVFAGSDFWSKMLPKQETQLNYVGFSTAC